MNTNTYVLDQLNIQYYKESDVIPENIEVECIALGDSGCLDEYDTVWISIDDYKKLEKETYK